MASEENLGVVLHAKNDVRVEPLPMPAPGPGEVVVRMDSVGICGSDVSYVYKGQIGHFVVRAPMVLGHESSGVVHALGEGVTELSSGRPGGHRAGRAVPPLRAVQARHLQPVPGRGVLRHAARCTVTCAATTGTRPTSATGCPTLCRSEEGALMEPLSVGVHACRRAGVTAGHRVLVCGAGPIGLVSLLAARALGAVEVVGDGRDGRPDWSWPPSWAPSTRCWSTRATRRQLAERVAALLGGHQPDVTIECSGAEPSIQLAIHATASGGAVVLVGMGPAVVSVPIIHAASREVDIRGIFRYANCYPTAIELVRRGLVDVKPLITHRFPLERSVEAFETARTGAGGAVKVMIKCQPEE
ncbi:Sorbitol dehydrogenase [Amphibalanus amphitrite]|uniref:Sorbitol dehydrogenase n=1 Tax=Amphibalanus amphitrite TaxID=1232801 RepID=A0A6A4XHN4_AMPAM|nr:Sorbitol dehydrogenase [Amphibalanus amphitrite]